MEGFGDYLNKPVIPEAPEAVLLQISLIRYGSVLKQTPYDRDYVPYRTPYLPCKEQKKSY